MRKKFKMYRLIICTFLLVYCAVAQAHHWVVDIYDGTKRFVAEVKVIDYRLINPHPILSIEITRIIGETSPEGIAVGQNWMLEMDNKRELTDLGFSAETFVTGDRIKVAVDPSYNSSYRKNTLYLRAAEHTRKGFIYVHNVRELFPIDQDGSSFSKHFLKIR